MQIHPLITDTESLEQLCAQLAKSDFITVDTEFMRENTYWPDLCLFQVASREEAAAIDPKAEGIDLAPLLELLEVLGLANRAEAQAAILPHGDERKLGVARALAMQPRFLLMDEPAAGLHEGEVEEFAGVVRSIRDERGVGVLLIDHNLGLILGVCDRIHVLDQGRTLAEGTPGEIRANLDVSAAYFGRQERGEGSPD